MRGDSIITYDLSKLYRAWEKHYTEMGLSYNKIQTMVHRKVARLKAPPGEDINKLIKIGGGYCS